MYSGSRMASTATGGLLVTLNLILIAFFAILLRCNAGETTPEEQIATVQKLKDKLFKNYDLHVRPAVHHTNESVVSFALIPLYVVELDEERSLFTLDAWYYLTWVDYRLAWNSSEYGLLAHFSISSQLVWKPDIMVYNAHSGNIDPKKDTHLLLLSNGRVVFVPPAQVQTYCSTLPDKSYPNDEVTCKVTFGSWSHDGWQVNLTLLDDAVYFDEFQNTNPRWELKLDQVNLTREVMHYNCCAEPYITLDMYFPLKRRTPQELEVVWSPCVLVMTLTLVMFWIPSDSGKKFALGSVLFLALTMLTVYVSVITKSPVFPKIAVSFISSTMYALTAALVLEVMVINMSSIVGPCRPPEILIRLLSGTLGKCIAVWPRWTEHIPGDKIQLKEDGEQMNTQPTPKDEWILVATSVDRVLFALYIIVLAAIHQA